MVTWLGKGGYLMPEHIKDPIPPWEPWYERGVPGQIPDPNTPDLTAPRHDEPDVNFDIVEPKHDEEESYGEPRPRA